MWASIAAAAIAAGTSIYGAIKKSKEAKRAARENQKIIDRAKADNDSYFNRNYYLDSTQLADNRAILTEANNRLRRSNASSAGSNVVSGATNSAAAAQKETNNETYAGMVRSVAANAQNRKNQVQENYMQNKANIAQGQMAINTSRQEANAAAVNTAVNGINTVAQSVASTDWKAKNG